MSPQALKNYQMKKKVDVNTKKKKFYMELRNLENSEENSPEYEERQNSDLYIWKLFERACRNADYASISAAMKNFNAIKEYEILHAAPYSKVHSECLPTNVFPTIVQSFKARKLERHIYETDCEYDETETIKKMGELQGSVRVEYASQAAEYSMRKLECSNNNHKFEKMQTLNSLMEVMISGGYHACRQVHEQTYDSIGKNSLNPTFDTYLRTMQALCLTGSISEAESIFNWLRNVQGPQAIGDDIRPWNILLAGYRDNNNYEACDALMKELFDSRFPVIMPHTADLYLRSIIDRAYTPLAGDISYYSQPYHAELKKIPLLVQKLTSHGIHAGLLTPPVLFHVNDAMISYKLSDSVKYSWNRSSGQFDFLNMRRMNQYVDDVQELTSSGGMKGNPQEKDQKGGTGQIPYYGRHGQKKTWEMLPADSLFYQFHVEEQMRDTKMDTKNTLVATDMYKRSEQWLHESPQTRYDQMQSLNTIDFKNVGIRRHLSSAAPEYEDVIVKDNKICNSAASLGRRAATTKKR